jgi:hypothetical protein
VRRLVAAFTFFRRAATGRRFAIGMRIGLLIPLKQDNNSNLDRQRLDSENSVVSLTANSVIAKSPL